MKRRGFNLIEVMVAIMLIAAAGAVCLEVLLLSATARRDAQRRHLATREAANVMERLMALPDDALTPETVKDFKLSEQAKQSLPQAQLAIRLDEQTDGELGATRVAVELVWQRRAGEPSPPIRLLAWRFRPKEATP